MHVKGLHISRVHWTYCESAEERQSAQALQAGYTQAVMLEAALNAHKYRGSRTLRECVVAVSAHLRCTSQRRRRRSGSCPAGQALCEPGGVACQQLQHQPYKLVGNRLEEDILGSTPVWGRSSTQQQYG